MICKKCGREYDDDMPKCLWCDAPNEDYVSPSEIYTNNAVKQICNAQENGLCECEILAKSAICWLKISFIPFLLIYILGIELFFKITLVSPLLVWFLPPLIFIYYSLCKTLYKSCKWLYFVEKHQHHFLKTNFLPWEAVFCALAPFVFPFVHYYIFQDLLNRQKDVLEKNKLKYNKLPRWVLPTIFIFGIVIQIGFFVVNFTQMQDGFFREAIALGSLLCFILFASYIKIIRTITANVSTLHSLASATSPTADTSSDFPDTSSSTPDSPSADAPCNTAASDEPNNDTPSDTPNNELDHDTPDNPQRPT